MATADVIYGREKTVDLYPKEDLDYLIKTEEKDKIEKEITFEQKKAPINAGDVLGKIAFKRDGETVAECDLISTVNIEKKTYFDIINEFIKQI